MRRFSSRFPRRRLIAIAGAGALLVAGLGAAAASAADAAAGPAPGTPATSVPMAPCAIKYVAGNLYVGSDNDVYKISQQNGTAVRVAPKFSFYNACGLTVDGAGNVLVADYHNGEIYDYGQVVAVAAKTGTFYGKKMVAGHVYQLATGLAGNTVDVQLDPAGNVVMDVGGYEASHTNNEQDSQVIVLAERAGTFYGHKMVKGKLYVIAGVLNGGMSSDPCDGGIVSENARPKAAPDVSSPAAATKAVQANLGWNIGTFRFDAEGNIILADSGGDGGGPCGDVYDVPPRVAVIPARTGSYYGQKMTVGYIYAIAGLGTEAGNGVPASDSHMYSVYAVALDHAGNVLVAAMSAGDYPNGPIRVIAAKSGTFYGQKMIKGDIYTLPALVGATAVAVDNAGNVLVGNVNGYLVQMRAVQTGTYYGVKARAGSLYTIAGNGKFPL